MKLLPTACGEALALGSGIGREGGAEMIRSYTQTKSIWLDLNPDFAYPFSGR